MSRDVPVDRSALQGSVASTTRPAGTGDLHLRAGLLPGDLAALSALTRTSGTAVLGPGLLQDLVEAGRDEDTVVIVAERDDVPLGFVHLDIPWHAAEGWLVSGAVDPECRRQGVGTALLDAAVRTARERGVPVLRISGRPHGYAAPGVDPEGDPATAAFLVSHGARPAGSALAMHRTLHDLDRAVPTAIDVGPCEPGERDVLHELVQEHLAADWAETLRAFVQRGGPPERILVARDASQELLGFACWGVVGRDPSRFGPFGVAPWARGHGAGGALLDAALLRMAGEGLAHAWFQWTGRDSPAHRLYTSRGFVPLRTFTPYTLPTGHVDVDRSQEGIAR